MNAKALADFLVKDSTAGPPSQRPPGVAATAGPLAARAAGGLPQPGRSRAGRAMGL